MSMCFKIVLLTIFGIATNALTIPQDGTKIIGGTNAIQGELPFMVSVLKGTDFLCSGVLIDVQWVLTSAFCVWEHQLQQLKVLVGGVRHSGTEVGRYEILVEEIIIHEDYLDSNSGRLSLKSEKASYYLFNNLALFKLKTAATPSNIVYPIVLTDFTEIIVPKTTVRVAGWGGSTNTAPNPTLQSSNNLETMDTVDCAIDILIELSNLDVCTVKTEQATCEFDHGGALFKWDSSRGYVLIGIVNYAPCGVALPNVYASTSGQRWWINKVTGL